MPYDLHRTDPMRLPQYSLMESNSSLLHVMVNGECTYLAAIGLYGLYTRHL